MRLHVGEGPDRRQVKLGARLGGGGEGVAYAVAGDARSAIKIYTVRENSQAGLLANRREKILGMLASPPRWVSVKHEGAVLPLLAWPTHLVESDEKGFAGFAMPIVPESAAMRFTDYLIQMAAPGSLSEQERCLINRLRLCRSLAGIVAELHKQGHFVVDFKPENLRVFHQSCIPCLLDNDSFSISGNDGRRFPATAFSPSYASPELLNQSSPADVNSDAQDRFALAALMFQVLNKGIHPFQGVLAVEDDEATTIEAKIRKRLYAYGVERDERVSPVPSSDHDCLLLGTRMMFDRAFGALSAADRPTAAEWCEHFDHLMRVSKPFERCQAHPESAIHIHFAGLPCPECRRIEAMAVAESQAEAESATETDGDSSDWMTFIFKLALWGGGIALLGYWITR